ncbi:MAG: histidine kinase [Chitinophagaceae bacterium]|nr:histidine kinase [Chitinophagaceae bacterium]MCA6453716.1 histidine kinase [Chitinophagaceae bacterium]MCA6455033.1 histidine kinase [Chitinophagaceae bacterium]MCA6458887.1 histidine kinase [Chitinophagaceae bacterium]MCA6464395.1 histidine kinase [Chitinophagaceae bacterium]
MRIIPVILLLFSFSQLQGQFPYAKKLNYPEQLPTQVVYDMLTDSQGYIWLGTDRGLYRFNGRAFVAVPFDNTSFKAVAYLQEDAQGTIWCMNFYNQLFYFQKDTLHRYTLDKDSANWPVTFQNVMVGANDIKFHSFKNIYRFDKRSHRLLDITDAPSRFDPIISSLHHKGRYYAFSNNGFLFSSLKNKWTNLKQPYLDFRLVDGKTRLLGLGIGFERKQPIEIVGDSTIPLPRIDLPADVYIFQAICVDSKEFWLCTQNGAYKWVPETGEVRCYFPNERVSDVVKDYQGNYWFSTLDNGVFMCASLYNTIVKIYNDPLLDNFTKLAGLPNGEIVSGNSHGLLSKTNLETMEHLRYKLVRERQTEFISYDSMANVIISNRGVFKLDAKEPLEIMDFNKGVIRDRYGNLVFAVFNGAYVINDQFRSKHRRPELNCRLYRKFGKDTVHFQGIFESILLRQKRALSVLASNNRECFWVGYDDGLYEYHYDADTIRILKDERGDPIIAKSLLQLPDGSLVAGTSTKGVMFVRNGTVQRTYTTRDGLSSGNIWKLLREDQYIWVLTDGGLDRIDTEKGIVSNYLEDYGLTSTIINDFIIQKGKILFATPSGILVRYNLPKYFNFQIKFPLLRASSNGTELKNNDILPGKNRDIAFYFESLHYLSSNALSYQYRMKGIDTIWRSIGNFTNQLNFNRLSPGDYVFEIKAVAGPNYKSVVKSFAFTVSKPFWQKGWFFLLLLVVIGLMSWFLLQEWKVSLLKRQEIKAQLLKSQLVALRAQMNPHFLYNVLNTVQGLVYGNRKTEAGELLGNFSDLMRKTLQASDKQLLPLQDEIDNLRLYLELEKARFDGGFEYQINLVNLDDISFVYVPSLMLQPFAENSVKHGLMHKKGHKEVLIQFEKEAGGLKVIIDDNGIGRTNSMEINKRSKNKPFSFATVALNERMNLFNSLYKQKITCRIIDKVDEMQQPMGTRVELLIPDYTQDPDAL